MKGRMVFNKNRGYRKNFKENRLQEFLENKATFFLSNAEYYLSTYNDCINQC